MDSELERLEDEAEAAGVALRDHLHTAVIAWYGREAPAMPERAVDRVWLDEYAALRERRDQAEAAVIAYLSAPTMPISPGEDYSSSGLTPEDMERKRR